MSTILQELEGFTFATSLDLNIGYYTISLDPDASKICTIDIGHRYNGPETGDWVQLHCKVRGSNPGPTKKIMMQGQGFEPWTLQK